jgi:hypothetical protein
MQTSLNYTELMDLLSTIASKSKLIGYSFELNNTEPEEEFKKYPTEINMVIDEPRERIIEGTGNRAVPTLTVYLLKHRSTRSAIVPNRRALKNDCRAAAVHVISYLRNEMRQGRLTDFDYDNSEMFPVDVFDLSWHGYALTISIQNPLDLSFKPDEWDSESSSSDS